MAGLHELTEYTACLIARPQKPACWYRKASWSLPAHLPLLGCGALPHASMVKCKHCTMMLCDSICILRMELAGERQGAEDDELLLVLEAPELIIYLMPGRLKKPVFSGQEIWYGFSPSIVVLGLASAP